MKAFRARALAKKEDDALESMEKLKTIYQSQSGTIHSHLLGHQPALSKISSYVTPDELKELRWLAETVGMNMSTLIRIVMTQLAGRYFNPLGLRDDPRR